jgi:hypothetical protein
MFGAEMELDGAYKSGFGSISLPSRMAATASILYISQRKWKSIYICSSVRCSDDKLLLSWPVMYIVTHERQPPQNLSVC